jgi:hypothetical protein
MAEAGDTVCMVRAGVLAMSLGGLVATTACSSPRFTDEGPEFREVQAVLQDRCIDACHEPGGLAYWTDMSGDTHAMIVRNYGSHQLSPCALVEPGDPDQSLVWHKILGSHLTHCNGRGRQMPLDREDLRTPVPLPADEIDLIEAWILAGAPP